MKIIAQSGLKYIPRWHRNHKEPEETQIVIEWNYLSGADREIVFGFEPIKFNLEGKITQEYTFKSDNVELLSRSIKDIKNLEIDDIRMGSGTRPVIIDDIINLPELAGLYKELTTYITTENAEGEKKN